MSQLIDIMQVLMLSGVSVYALGYAFGWATSLFRTFAGISKIDDNRT